MEHFERRGGLFEGLEHRGVAHHPLTTSFGFGVWGFWFGVHGPGLRVLGYVQDLGDMLSE